MELVGRPRLDSLLPCGSESARRRHLAHGRACAVCWPDGGLPAMPDTTVVPGWLADMIADEFGPDIPEELVA
ncbi:hypothetical protein O7626_39875 [Micromonospora sp. WMMD1102]|uniref:hypothetical protein n=1 Tax=Micromonospora sp. WMMD1102 TaxID=3016105 RepID=UPI0024151C68|nr:hypothetical protein [Micromonospora sp. WMMD1102]MDG4791975.1 hypothetical protein [Micromonospora sp. WMMD1102]